MFGLLRSFRPARQGKNFSSSTYKDYYGLLGLSKNATQQQIADAYRSIAVNFHSGFVKNSTEVDNSSFKDISEAYAVLSDSSRRYNYDASNKSNPSVLREQVLHFKEVRGGDGNRLGHEIATNQYAVAYKQFLSEQRGKFNVDNNSTYRGGVPNKGAGRARGSALAEPGAFHSEDVHNDMIDPLNAEQIVDSNKVTEFSNLKQHEKDLQTLRTTWYRATVDKDFFEFKNNQVFFSTLRWAAIFFFLSSIFLENEKMVLRMELGDLEKAAKSGLEVSPKGSVKVGDHEFKISDSGVVRKLH